MHRSSLVILFSVLLCSEAAAQSRSPSRAYQAEYQRAQSALTARQARETRAEDRRCRAALEPSRGDRIRAAAASGNADIVRSGFRTQCEAARDMLQGKHLAEWMELDEAFREGRPLPDLSQPDGEAPGDEGPSAEERAIAQARKELEQRINEERRRLGELTQSRDDNGSYQALENDIEAAQQRVSQAEDAMVSHLRQHAPDEVAAYEYERWNNANRPMQRIEDVQDFARRYREEVRDRR
ncbi:MAG: hypothetical protein EON91_02110 [Brevundimonas sp.]|uniref:hypothetical protein n=1 Tax=Brevundimonas sp. TaxID=1871086 RepID=UPI0012068E54|nr:hypothetical protein [Brevundimonas sp.]RZJ19180.1 MAG: hypothetical protein EON91_02110 [Brevundimonas sp.]